MADKKTAIIATLDVLVEFTDTPSDSDLEEIVSALRAYGNPIKALYKIDRPYTRDLLKEF